MAATAEPRVLFFGAGAVGSLLGARLAQAGCAVTLVGRQPHMDLVARAGVRLQVAGHSSQQSVRAAVSRVADAQGPFDFVLLTVKSYDTMAAVEAASMAVRPGSILGTFQNGVGNEEAIAAAAPEQGLLSGCLTIAVSLAEAGMVVQHGRTGGVALAPGSPEVNVAPLVRKFDGAGVPAERLPDFRAMKWSKLLLNILGNAQSAILDLPPERVFADFELFRYERLAFREATAVMDRLGLAAVRLPGFNVPALKRVMALPALLAQMLLQPRVARARGSKMPSLWWDVQKGQGRTEVQVINGAVVDAGARNSTPTPVNSVLWAILEQVAASPAERERYRGQPGRLKALLRTAARL